MRHWSCTYPCAWCDPSSRDPRPRKGGPRLSDRRREYSATTVGRSFGKRATQTCHDNSSRGLRGLAASTQLVESVERSVVSQTASHAVQREHHDRDADGVHTDHARPAESLSVDFLGCCADFGSRDAYQLGFATREPGDREREVCHHGAQPAERSKTKIRAPSGSSRITRPISGSFQVNATDFSVGREVLVEQVLRCELLVGHRSPHPLA